MIAAKRMTNEEIVRELDQLRKRLDDLLCNIDEGHGGSPGEWMVERMDELESEQRRRPATHP